MRDFEGALSDPPRDRVRIGYRIRILLRNFSYERCLGSEAWSAILHLASVLFVKFDDLWFDLGVR